MERVEDIKTNKGLKAVVDALCENLKVTSGEDTYYVPEKEQKEVDESTEAKKVAKEDYDTDMTNLLTNFKASLAKLNVKKYSLRLIEIIVKKEPKSKKVMTKLLDNTDSESALEDSSKNIKKVIKKISNLSFAETDQTDNKNTVESILKKLSSSYELIEKEKYKSKKQETSEKELENSIS